MDRVVLHAEGADPALIRRAAPGLEFIEVHSQRRLVEALVGEHELTGAVIGIGEISERWEHLLDSISRSFPLLPVLIVQPPGKLNCPDEYGCVEVDADESELALALQAAFGGVQKERREHHRFEWPLQARIVNGDGTLHRIAEISAGGAFLEPVGSGVKSGDETELEILFQNFAMKTRCRILDPRHVSSHRSAGFGVRFPELSAEASRFIDRIVDDALVQLLLDPSMSPSVPSLDEDEDILEIGDEFTLV